MNTIPQPRVICPVHPLADTWKLQAACRGMDTRLWYPAQGLRAGAEAKAVCAGCPVRAECLAYVTALPGPERRYGIWGGLSDRERRARRRARRVERAS